MNKILKIIGIGCLGITFMGILGIYIAGKKIDSATNTEGITRISDKYGKTEDTLYYFTYGYHMGIKQETTAEPNSFVDLTGGYGKDTHNAFFEGKKISGADANTFEVIDQFYRIAKDKNDVYDHGEILPNASPTTYEVKQY